MISKRLRRRIRWAVQDCLEDPRSTTVATVAGFVLGYVFFRLVLGWGG